jgi:hypothetical protein
MPLTDLHHAIATHAGQFLCERIHQPTETRLVDFHHVINSPTTPLAVPDLPGLRDFYATFGSVTFYVDAVSGDAAAHLAHPDAWAGLADDFHDGLDTLDDDERTELLPAWIGTCLVIGDVPGTGNYLLMPTQGPQSGEVVLFDHDGFEFTTLATSLPAYVQRLLAPDAALLASMASHMRFIDGDPMVQWWIREMRDHRGGVVTTA